LFISRCREIGLKLIKFTLIKIHASSIENRLLVDYRADIARQVIQDLPAYLYEVCRSAPVVFQYEAGYEGTIVVSCVVHNVSSGEIAVDEKVTFRTAFWREQRFQEIAAKCVVF